MEQIMFEIKVPEMGESIIEASIGRWLKQEGDPVTPGDPVVELETDKVNLEVGAQQAGILQAILRKVGETVSVGDVLAYIAGAVQSDPASETEYPHPAAAEPIFNSREPQIASGAPVQVSVTPVAQRMAQDMGINLAQVKPGGGRITKEDVQAFAKKTSATAQPLPGKPVITLQATPELPMQTASAAEKPPSTQTENRRETRVRMTRRRQTIARRLVEAQHTAAMLTTFNEVDMSAVVDLRKRRRESFKERFGVDLGFMPFFVKAAIGALKAFPTINAEIASSGQGEEIVLKSYYDIGIAIGAEEGLVVPVVRDADRLSFAAIEKAIREYSAKVKNNTLTLEDLRGGTFTITNGGVFGSLLSTPILNSPQVAILGMHKIQERPIALRGEIVIRPMMYLALSYDHRIVDGREAVQFLVRVKELVEDPETLLLS